MFYPLFWTVFVLFVIMITYSILKQKPIEKFEESAKLGTCSSKSCSGSSDLMPVNDPEHNLREIIKQLLLVEDHMFQDDKKCIPCIRKHLLTIEALGEEGVTLDVENKYTAHFNEVIHMMRKLELSKDFSNTSAQEVRELRRNLMSAQ